MCRKFIFHSGSISSNHFFFLFTGHVHLLRLWELGPAEEGKFHLWIPVFGRPGPELRRPQINRSHAHFPLNIFHTEGRCVTLSDNNPYGKQKKEGGGGEIGGPRQVGWENIFPFSDQASAQPNHYRCCSMLPSQVSVMAATTTVTLWYVISSYLFHKEIIM